VISVEGVVCVKILTCVTPRCICTLLTPLSSSHAPSLYPSHPPLASSLYPSHPPLPAPSYPSHHPLPAPSYPSNLAFPTGQSIIIGSVVDIQVNTEKTFAAIKLNDSRGESVILLVTGCLKQMLSAVPQLGTKHCEYGFAQAAGTGTGIVALVFQAHLLLESDPLISMKGP
jgi:hypothetical protein